MPDKPKSTRKKAQAVNLDTLGLEMGNKPPQALEVEEAVLGAMLIEPSSVDMALEELSPSCFYDPRHKMIYEAMSELVNEHTSVDIVTVSSKLREKGNLEAVGGPVAIAGLSEKVGAAAHIEYYVKILKQKSIQRDLITASYEILRDSYDDSVKVDQLIDEAQTKVYNAIQNNLKKDVQEVGSIINDALREVEKNQNIDGLSGVPSGFPSLDRVTRGWQKSDLIILAARPSVGKTAFALNLARNAAVDNNMPVAVFSLEMSALQLVMRLMTTESGLPADKLKGGAKLDPWDWQQLETRLAALSKAPLYIDDTPSIPLMEFRTKVKRLVKSKDVRLVIVDYLQLMQGPVELRGLREQEVAAISRTLKATAKELNVPIIALSQLSRNAVQRTGGTGKPQLSDLRESGSIEQDADMVIFIHRPDYVGLGETPDGKETTQIIIAKHRNGEVCDIDMLFKSDQVRFVEPGDSLAAQAEYMGTESAMNSEFDNNPDF
ncbi:MAG: replicative DNA helicase [Bacteroidales bacterium]|nr:replicative DNA helicase [Bacteroidales bacterium]MBO6221693.1 replicative DNA helicase [Bacteroidales bacterium]MBQ3979018.1 replicative DNA helicase [Bacteroidales bacterium]MBQ6184840.1 replicative DNA helicase [Bacteroidales bacterium]